MLAPSSQCPGNAGTEGQAMQQAARGASAKAVLPIALALSLMLVGHPSAAQTAVGEGRQWQPAEWPTGRPMSLFDLVEQGYEVRAYQPGLDRSWLYLQKDRRLFRCHAPEHDTGAAICEQLVAPY